MGMDVYGKQPSHECGEYFRASIWSWPVIHQLMATTCRDLLGEELLKAMEYNDGAGPDDQATCESIADRLEQALKETVDCAVPDTCRIDTESEKVDPAVLMKRVHEGGGKFSYTMRNSLVTEWIEFLRHCGGFEVC